MYLRDYLRLVNVSVPEFALKMGAAERAVRNWVNGAVIPRTSVMLRIIEDSKGAVTVADFYAAHAEYRKSKSAGGDNAKTD